MVQLSESGVNMATSGTPLMRSSGQVPYVPTGYEGLQSQAASKRKIAEALLAQGLAGPGNSARSWAEVLGSMADAWAGKSLQKDADKLDEQVRQRQMQAAVVANQAYEADKANGMTWSELSLKYGGVPLLQERLKQDDHPLENINGVATDMRGTRPGTVLPQNRSADVLIDPQGNSVVNAAKVASVRAATGLPTDPGNPTGTFPDITKYAPQGQAPNPVVGALMGQQPPVQMAPMSMQKNWTMGPETMGGQAAADASFAAQQPRFEVNAAGTQEVKKLPDGRMAYKINGEWYDNPEGK